MKIHENFDMETVDYDVCVLTVRKNLELRLSIFTYFYFSSIIIIYSQLAGVIEMNEYAAPISLCTENEWAEGSKFTVTGWGLKSVCIMIEQQQSSETTISTLGRFLAGHFILNLTGLYTLYSPDHNPG